jgi:hypothetical protein
METEEKALEYRNGINIREAKKSNTESVKKCLSFYEKKMESVLNDNLIFTEEAFREQENSIEDQTIAFFSNTCKSGESDFIEKYELELHQYIRKSKRKFKKQFREESVKFESKCDEEINNCLEYYRGVMLTLSTKDEFKMKHKEFKLKATDCLKNKLLIKDQKFLNKQISKLESYIEKEFSKNLLNQFEKLLDERKTIYSSHSLKNETEEQASYMSQEVNSNLIVLNGCYTQYSFIF